MELIKNQSDLSATERKAMAEDCIAMMHRVENNENENIVTSFRDTTQSKPFMDDKKHVYVPTDVVDCVVGKFREKGYYLWVSVIHPKNGMKVRRFYVTKRNLQPFKDARNTELWG